MSARLPVGQVFLVTYLVAEIGMSLVLAGTLLSLTRGRLAALGGGVIVGPSAFAALHDRAGLSGARPLAAGAVTTAASGCRP